MKKIHLLALALCSTHALAGSFIVNETRDLIDANLSDGVCETEFKTCSLRAAIQEANKGKGSSTIELPNNTYELTLSEFGENLAASGDFDIHNDITINGIGNPVIDANQFDRHFDIHGSNKNNRLELNNISLINGKSFEEYGGSIKAASNITLNNVEFNNNTNDNDNIGFGGALYISKNSSAFIKDSTFAFNRANMGGGIFNEGYAFTTGSTFTENESQLGGAIYNKSVFTLNENLLSNNTSRLGAGVFNEKYLNASLNSYDSNTANLGGAIYNEAETELFSFKETVSNNKANNGAGIFNIGKLEILKAFANQNIAESNGGFIINNGSILIDKSTIDGNSADNGGAIYNQGEIIVTNSNILSNTATVTGGVLHNEKGSTQLQQSTLLNNSAGNIEPVYTVDGTFRTYGTLFIETALIDLCNAKDSSITKNISEGYNTFSTDSCNSITDDLIEATNTTVNKNQFETTVTPEITSAGINHVEACLDTDSTNSLRDTSACDVGAYESNSTPSNPGVISFELDTINVSENNASNKENTLLIPVFRTDGSDGQVTVNYQTVGVNTSTGDITDFTMTSGTLKWAHKDADTKYIDIVINDDLKIENDEKLFVVLSGSNLSKNYSSITVNIQDDDRMRGTFDFELAESEITENTKQTLKIIRSEYSQHEVDLNFDITETTNINLSEIKTDVNTVTFSDGQIENTLEVSITDNDIFQPNRSFKIKLSDQDNTVKLGENNIIKIKVNEDELKPTYGQFFIVAPNNTTEGTSNILTIKRTSNKGFIQGEVTFSLATSNDLITLSESEITFTPTDETKDITFTTKDDETYNTESQSVVVTQTISSFNGGEVEATEPSAAEPVTINIIDNEAPPEDSSYSFSANELIFEAEGLTKEVKIIRSGGSAGSDTILFEIVNGTGTAEDIELSNIAFTFEDGESEKTLSIKSVIDNTFESAKEELTINLKGKDGTVTIGESSSLKITLNDGLNDEDNTLSKTSGSTNFFILFGMIALAVFRRK